MMENHEENDDENVHDDVAMNNETGNANANANEDEDNNTGGQVVEEYVSTPADFQRILNHYGTVDDEDDDNPVVKFRLNIVSSTIRNIPDRALYLCGALTDLRVLQGGRGGRILLRTIGERAFWNCRNLRRINQFLKQGGVIRLGEMAFTRCDFIEGELLIPRSVVFVGGDCFQECTSITSVVFEASSTGTAVEIQEGAFSYCTELSSAILPPTLERISYSCFGDCTALINVPIPPTVVELGAESFAMCTSLPSMELPESVDAIGRDAFLDCTALTTVTIRTASFDLRMGNNVFGGCTSLTTINVRPWIWGKLLSSMERDATFLNKFFNGTFTTGLASIHMHSWYGAHILESV